MYSNTQTSHNNPHARAGTYPGHGKAETTHCHGPVFRYKGLERFVLQYRIIFDTCSLLHDKFRQLWGNLEPLLTKYDRKVIVPSSCVRELRKISQDKHKELGVQKKAATILAFTLEQQSKGLIRIDRWGEEYFADPQIRMLVISRRLKENILVVTQDGNLAKDLMPERHAKSQDGGLMQVKKIDDSTGRLTNLLSSHKSKQVAKAALTNLRHQSILKVAKKKKHIDFIDLLLS